MSSVPGAAGQNGAQTSLAQVRRLLSLIPYLREHDGVAISDVAEAFGVTPQRIREDLNELWMCGLPGLSPGDMIDIDMDAVEGEGVIHLSNADYLTRPLRLSADEALALTLALQTLREVTAYGDRAAVDRALAKLHTVVSGRTAGNGATDPVPDRAEVSVTGGAEEIRATLNEALRRHKRLDLTYDVASRAETTRRYVDPLRVFVLDGYGYLDAWCYSAGGLRSFRLDRIAAVEITDVDIAEHDVQLRDLSGGWFDALKDAPLVTLALAPGAAWVAEYYPMESVTPADDGGLTVSVRVSDPAWLRSLLLRLGGGARVLAPEGAGDSAADAAQEALDQYAALAAQPGPDTASGY
jgi:proteasome accessory factor C